MHVAGAQVAIAESDAVLGEVIAPVGQVRSEAVEPLARLQASIERFLDLAAAVPRSPAALLHETAERMHQFSSSILACEEAGLDRTVLLPRVIRLRALHARSPFVERL